MRRWFSACVAVLFVMAFYASAFSGVRSNVRVQSHVLLNNSGDHGFKGPSMAIFGLKNVFPIRDNFNFDSQIWPQQEVRQINLWQWLAVSDGKSKKLFALSGDIPISVDGSRFKDPLPSILNVRNFGAERPRKIPRWRLAGVHPNHTDHWEPQSIKAKFHILHGEITPNLGLSDIARNLVGFSRVISRSFCISGSGDSGSERQSANEGSNSPNNPSCFNGVMRRISSLPLSAQVGASILISFLAWLAMLRGFVLIVDGRRNLLKGAFYLFIGCVGWLFPNVVWWLSSS